jgi:hypothetical protein
VGEGCLRAPDGSITYRGPFSGGREKITNWLTKCPSESCGKMTYVPNWPPRGNCKHCGIDICSRPECNGIWSELHDCEHGDTSLPLHAPNRWFKKTSVDKASGEEIVGAAAAAAATAAEDPLP